MLSNIPLQNVLVLSLQWFGNHPLSILNFGALPLQVCLREEIILYVTQWCGFILTCF